MWEYDEQDALATAKVWADGGQADAVANMARAFVAMRRERDASARVEGARGFQSQRSPLPSCTA